MTTGNRDGRSWPAYLFGGRLRTSTLALILAFVVIWWAYESYGPEPDTPEQVPASNVVPPGFIPDPAYTWVPRTEVQQPETSTAPETPTTTDTATTTPTTPGADATDTPTNGQEPTPTSGATTPTPTPTTTTVPGPSSPVPTTPSASGTAPARPSTAVPSPSPSSPNA